MLYVCMYMHAHILYVYNVCISLELAHGSDPVGGVHVRCCQPVMKQQKMNLHLGHRLVQE